MKVNISFLGGVSQITNRGLFSGWGVLGRARTLDNLRVGGLGDWCLFLRKVRMNQTPAPGNTPAAALGLRAAETPPPCPRAAVSPACIPASSAGSSLCHSHGAGWGSKLLHRRPSHRKPGKSKSCWNPLDTARSQVHGNTKVTWLVDPPVPPPAEQRWSK